MTTLADIRKQYPQYSDMTDDALARALHGKFYSDMSYPEFSAKIGLQPTQPNKDTGITSALDAAAIAAGHKFDRTAAGLRAAVPEPVRAGIDWLGQKLGMAQPPSIDPAEVAAKDAAMEPLKSQYPKATFVGDLGASAAMGGPTPAGMAVMSALDYGTPQERAQRAVLNLAAGKVGEGVGSIVADQLAQRAAGKAAAREAAQVANAPRDATIREAQAAGFVIPPTQVNPTAPGFVNRMLEGTSGKIQTGQAASIKNQPLVTSISKKEAGLGADEALTVANLKRVRTDAGKAYEAVRGVGTVKLGDEFVSDFGETLGPYLQLRGEVPSRAISKIDELVKDLAKPEMEAGTIVDLVKDLRFSGFRNVRSPDPSTAMLGKAELGAMDALENALERHLAKIGQTSALDNLRAARTLIAKNYTVENALEESTGKVVASKIGKEFANGKPLTGDLALVGKVAQAFPKAVQNVNSSMPGVSPLDAALSAILGVGSGNVGMAALPLIRPVVRAGILSAPYQRAMAGASNYGPTLTERLAASAGAHPLALRNAGGLLGLFGPRLSRRDSQD